MCWWDVKPYSINQSKAIIPASRSAHRRRSIKDMDTRRGPPPLPLVTPLGVAAQAYWERSQAF